MTRKPKYYITTAIAYTSGKPHIGNTYEIILTDSIARFKRKQGYDVFFQTGTDEHGEKIELKSAAAGKTPKEFVDGVAGEIKSIWDLMNVSYDKFVRTTDDYHEKQVQKIFRKMYDKGDIYKGSYKGLYCTPCESFWTESQLVNGKCPDCGREVKPAEEEAYFFKMSKYADRLQKFLDDNPEFISPVSRKNEMVNNFLKPGLQDLCVTRTSFKWGIPVDFDPKHVVYVWLDALANYITGIGYDAEGNSSEQFERLWPADLHVIGKDIVRFHTLYWPIFLMSLDLPLPKRIFGHPWLLQDGGKMSKSKGNVIYADDMAEIFGVDAVRYYVLSEMPFDNVVNRTVAMSNKYFGGMVENKHVCADVDDDLKQTVVSAYKKVAAKMDEFKTADALDEVFKVFRRANKYIDETTPWALAKDPANADRLKTVLYNLTETIVIGASLLAPFMPEKAEKAAELVGAKLRDFDSVEEFGLTKDGTKVSDKPEFLFSRLDADEVMEKVEVIQQKYSVEPKEEYVEVPKADEITIDDFAKIQLSVGKVLTAEKVEKADKLLKMTVKVGQTDRTIVSGIAKWYKPEEMVGKEVVVVSNLKPAKLRGIMSEGMILCADDGKGNLCVVSPEKTMLSGSEVR